MNYQQLIEAAKNSTKDEETLARLNSIRVISGWANKGEDAIILYCNWHNIMQPPGYFSYANNIMVQLEMDLAKHCPDIYIGRSHLLSICNLCNRAMDATHKQMIYDHAGYGKSYYCFDCANVLNLNTGHVELYWR